MTKPQTNFKFPESSVIVYREYGPTIQFPAQVFSIGPHTVDDYDCGGSYEEQWRLDPETADGVNLSTDSAVPVLKISDSAALMNFKLTVMGSYTFEG